MLLHVIIRNVFCPFPIFTYNIFPHVFNIVGYHLVNTDEVCIAIYLSPKHIYSPLSQAMATTCYLQPCFIQMRVTLGFISCSTPVCISTFTIVNKALFIKNTFKLGITYSKRLRVKGFLEWHHVCHKTKSINIEQTFL